MVCQYTQDLDATPNRCLEATNHIAELKQDITESEIDPRLFVLTCFGNGMLPMMLSVSGHDQQIPMS